MQVLLVSTPRETELASVPRETKLMVKPSEVKAKLADMALATQLIRSASHAGVPALLKIVQSWKDAQISDLNSGMQTLALVPKDIKTELQVGRRLARKLLLPVCALSCLALARSRTLTKVCGARRRATFARRRTSSSTSSISC
jgi:hypothetical protein